MKYSYLILRKSFSQVILESGTQGMLGRIMNSQIIPHLHLSTWEEVILESCRGRDDDSWLAPTGTAARDGRFSAEKCSWLYANKIGEAKEGQRGSIMLVLKTEGGVIAQQMWATIDQRKEAIFSEKPEKKTTLLTPWPLAPVTPFLHTEPQSH